MSTPIIFCADPLDAHAVDPAYAPERDAALALGLDTALLDFEALLHDTPSRAVRRIPQQDPPQLGVYRGWMLQPARYVILYRALADRGVRLINDPEAYRHCHYLPESYPVIAARSARTVWMPLANPATLDLDAVMALLQPFGDRPLVLKDYVKSQKGLWSDACFIPNAADRREVERVVRRFLELQGPDLNEGLVFRAYVQLEPLATHTRSGMPLAREYRTFFLDGEPTYTAPYWEDGDYAGVVPPRDLFLEVARRVHSRFFTMDVARRADGEWTIIELGDGQVAGLPASSDALAFYGALAERWPAG